MSSSVFYKFKSQREPTRVEFDGTGISVFELKREIITKSGLGDGTDFDLFIYTVDNAEEYDDDTTIIPRSTTVIARRQPAIKPGAGRAARYVSGKMPISAKNAGRREQAAKSSAPKPSSTAINQMHNAMTEEEKMAAMFAAQTEQWSAQQEELSHQTPVFKPGGQRKPANVPDHDPPNGYICYRCGQKGHWIQACPTNSDETFDNRPRVKRATGVPKSMLAKIDKSAVLAQTDGDESKRPSGVMVDADGDFVVAKTDKATWEKFQAKANTTSAKAKTAEDKQIEERGLACSLDKKMFVDPMKTPCCRKTFCNDCITNALIESDFVCPACQTEGVLLDDLQPDEEMSEKVQEYLKEQKTAKSPEPASPTRKAEDAKIVETAKTEGESKEEPEKTEEAKNDKEQEENSEEKSQASGAKDKTKSPTPQPAKTNSPPTGPKSMAPQDSDGTKTEGAKPDESNPKKRQADDFLENPRIPKGPRAMQNQQQNQMPSMGMNGMPPNMGGMNGMMGMPPNMNMGMPNMMGMPGMNMGMPPPMMGMPMMGIPGFNGNFGMNSGGGGWDMGNMGNMGNMGMNGFGGGMMNGFQNGMNFGPQNGGGAEEDAYFRKPVNPHRHQNKQRRTRPSDYREL